MSTGSQFTYEDIANHGKPIYKTLETYGFEHNWSDTRTWRSSMSEQSNNVVEIDDDELEVEKETTSTANVGETSVEINIEELIAELELEGMCTQQSESNARKKLEDILEQRRIARELEDMDKFEIDS